MSPTYATLMYAELLSNIRQISVLASFQPPSTQDTNAELLNDRQHLKLTHNGDAVLLRLPAQIAAVPKLQQPVVGSHESSWRLPLASQDAPRATPDSASAPWSASHLSEQSEISCRKCENILLAAGSIQVWKDLPSENWAEMMDFWHCHKPDVPKGHTADNDSSNHLLERGYGANTRFAARKGVGFVDLTYFLLAKEDCPGIMVGKIIPCHLVAFYLSLPGVKKEAMPAYAI
jgi:hypothetical protein